LSRGKAIGWSIAFFASGIAASMGAGYLLSAVAPGLDALTLQTIALMAGFLATTAVIAGLGLKWDLSDLRWTKSGASPGSIGLALLLGVAPAVLVLGVAVPVGGAGWSLDGETFGAWAMAIGGLGLSLLPAAFIEEVMFRGVAFVALARAFGPWRAAIGLSVLFAAAHLANPNVTWLGVANIALAGIFLSGVFYLGGGIWSATAAHLGWNLTLAALGAPVSGLGFTLPMLDYATGEPGWLTGGTFGPEGGVLATMVLGAATVLVARRVGSRSMTNDQ
jgi:membrane protease YdiL (CAAX protease family)